MEDKDKKVEIKLERHLWPDEEEALNKKKKQKKKKILLIVVVILLVLSSLGLGLFLGKKIGTIQIVVPSSARFSRLEAIYETLIDDWYFAKDVENVEENLINRAISGMIDEEIDPHTVYMSAEEAMEFTQSIDMGFVGVGISYTISGDYALVKTVFYDSPADKAGIKPGDLLSAVDGVSIAGWTTDEIKEKVQGEKGSVVRLTYLRDNQEYTAECIRDVVENSIYGEIRDDVGYIQIYQFSSVAAEEIENYLKMFTDKGITKLILDVRDDGGGYLTSLINVANLFLDKDQIILTQEYSDGTIIESRADGKNQYVFDRFVILGNDGSASASEALIAALTENDKAVFVGTKTYGKSTIQVPAYFSDGSSLKYTHGMWKTPKGNIINKVGITPDVEVKKHPVLDMYVPMLEENEHLVYDTVDDRLICLQASLDFLGYDVDRMDGYFSAKTMEAVKQFEKDNNLAVDGEIDDEENLLLTSKVTALYNSNTSVYDTQMKKAMELMHE